MKHLQEEQKKLYLILLTLVSAAAKHVHQQYLTQGGGICQNILEGVLTSLRCDTDEMPFVLRDNEASARLLIPALRLLSPSSECLSVAVPLLCLHLFGLCDSSGVSIQPTSGQCKNVRDNLCSAEWQQAMALFDFPNCDDFPEVQPLCRQADSGPSNVSLGTPPPNVNNQSHPCQEDFFRSEDSGLCVPNCHTWSEYPPSVAIGTDVIVALTAIVGFVTGLAVFIVSLLRFRKIFTFPSVFIFYMNFDVLVLGAFNIITYFDRPSLYCTSKSLGQSAIKPTVFCVLAGIIFVYALVQLGLWWLFHTSALLWKVGFPFHARSFDNSGKTKYIHIACVVVGLVVPAIPVVAVMANFGVRIESSSVLQAANVTFLSGGLGFGLSRFPPIFCHSTSSGSATFYGFGLLLLLIFSVGITELIILFALVHKQHGVFIQKKSVSSHFKIGTPERKILIALCFYVVLMIFAVPSVTMFSRVSRLYAEDLIKYFLCEEQGVDPNNPGLCDKFRDGFRKFSYPELTTSSFALINLFPVVFLVYTLDFKQLKGKVDSIHARRKKAGSTQTTNISNAGVSVSQ